MKKNNYIFTIILIILFGLLFVVYNSKKISQPKQTVAPSKQIHLSPSTTPNVFLLSKSTMNWKLYTDNKVGYSLKYPLDWTVDLHSEGCGPVFRPSNTKKVWLTVCGPYIDKGDTPETLAERYGPGKKLLFREKVKVDNHMGIRQDIVSEDSDFYNYSIEVFIGDIPTMVNDGKNINEERIGTIGIYCYIQDKAKLDQVKTNLTDILGTFALE